MGFVQESEVVLRKKSATELEVVDSRGRDKVYIQIPGVYRVRQEPSPVVVDLSTPPLDKNAVYSVYAKDTGISWGLPRGSTGFDILVTKANLVERHKYLGPVLTDSNGEISGMSIDGNEITLNSRVNVDLGNVYKEKDTIHLPIPPTATKVILSVAVRSSESEGATARLFVLGEKKSFEFVESSIGETTAEKVFKMPVPDALNTITYKIDAKKGTEPTLTIQILGWVDGALEG